MSSPAANSMRKPPIAVTARACAATRSRKASRRSPRSARRGFEARRPPRHPSLRAKRSNPECPRGKTLDCFVANAPRNDAWRQQWTHLRILAVGFKGGSRFACPGRRAEFEAQRDLSDKRMQGLDGGLAALNSNKQVYRMR